MRSRPLQGRSVWGRQLQRSGNTNTLLLLFVITAVVIGGLGLALYLGSRRPTADSDELMVYCAAGMRKPFDAIAAEYKRRYGVNIVATYGGSNTLLGQLEANPSGDLYIAADQSYLDITDEKGLTQEQIPVAHLTPVIAVEKGNPKNIKSIKDLLKVRVSLGEPSQAAVGKKTKKLLTASGDWEALENHVLNEKGGVFKPTVPDVANDVKVGAVDAAIIWDSEANQHEELEVIHVPELDAGKSQVGIAVLDSCKQPAAALRFARFLTASDEGLKAFAAHGFEIADGDKWEESPTLTFYSGAVNQAALQPVLEEFEEREGVTVNVSFGGCGTLTGQMRGILDADDPSSFPDAFMACDVYYIDDPVAGVGDLFQERQDVSNTSIVIVTQEGNPKGIKTLEDLTKDGVRVVLGDPTHCTIGVLSKQLLEEEGLFEAVSPNVKSWKVSSANLIPDVVTSAADAVLAYKTDAGRAGGVEIIEIDSPKAAAIQPWALAKISDQKNLTRRLYQKIAHSREFFEKAGFTWRLEAP